MIEKKAIKKMLLPCGELPAEDLKLFVDEVYTKFAENEAKAIVNMFIGNMGSKYNKEIKGCITDSEVEARSLQALYDHIEIFEMNGLYLVKQVAKERLVEDNTSINRFVVCGGILKVFETMRLTMVCGVSRLVSIRTDCVYVENPREIKERHLVNSNDAILANLGKLKIEKDVHPVKKITWEGTEREGIGKGFLRRNLRREQGNNRRLREDLSGGQKI